MFRRQEGKEQGAAAEAGQGDVIRTVADLPKGRYLAFGLLEISPQFAGDFLVLSSTGGKVILVCSQDAWGSHRQFDLINRLRAAGMQVAQIRPAMPEVIAAVHQKHERFEDPEQSDVEEAAWRLVRAAADAGASDLHIETRNTYAQVFFRVHGERIEQPNISYEAAYQICSVLYVVHADANAKDVSWSPDRVLDTSIEHLNADGTHWTLRFSSAPIYPSAGKNFHCVLRLLQMESASARSLEAIGYTERQIDAIEDMIVGAQGCVLLVGPTNSGKSTSMQAIMRRIYDRRGPSIKAITIEKPVEYLIPGACQMGVPEGRKDSNGQLEKQHEALIRATLRQDPDVVMVGEIRDQVEAEPVKNLVLAGRKLISTLHVYEAMAIYERLVEIGVPRGILMMDGFISGVIYQRLVPRLCPHCSEPVEVGHADGRIRRALWERLAPAVNAGTHELRLRRPGGCERCNQSGIIGRLPCAEILVPDAEFLRLMRAGDSVAARAYWETRSGLDIDGLGVTALAHATRRMLDGELDPRDVESQVGLLHPALMQAAARARGRNGPPRPALAVKSPPSVRIGIGALI